MAERTRRAYLGVRVLLCLHVLSNALNASQIGTTLSYLAATTVLLHSQATSTRVDINRPLRFERRLRMKSLFRSHINKGLVCALLLTPPPLPLYSATVESAAP